MRINNFKELEKLELENVSMNYKEVENNISSNLGSLRFITNVIDLFFPKVVDLFVGLSGGKPSKIEPKKQSYNKYPDMQ